MYVFMFVFVCVCVRVCVCVCVCVLCMKKAKNIEVKYIRKPSSESAHRHDRWSVAFKEEHCAISHAQER